MANNIADGPVVNCGVELVLAQCRPQLDEILGMIREMAEERRQATAEKRASALVLTKLLNQLKSTDSPEPELRSLQ